MSKPLRAANAVAPTAATIAQPAAPIAAIAAANELLQNHPG